MKKRYFVILSGIFLSFIFIFLYFLTGNNKEITVKTISDIKERQVLHFTSSWAGYDTRTQQLQTTLQNYEEKYPYIELINESMVGEDFLFTLKTDFASGNEPDVFGLWPGSDFDLLVEQGKVADLTQLLKENPEWYNQFRDDTWKYVTVDDKIYGLPFEIIYEGLFINKDLFERYNVKIPTTFDELLLAVEAFNSKGIIPIAYSGTPEGSFIYQNIVMKLGGKEDVENPFTDDGKMKQCFVDGMYYMKELYDANAFPEDAFIIDDKTRNDLFLSKKAAMIVQGSWFIGEQGVNPYDSSVEIIPFPSFENGKADYTSIIYGCGNGIFHISQNAWEDETIREASINLLKELTSVETAVRFTSAGGFISNVIVPDNKIIYTPMYLKGERLIDEAKELVGPTDSFIDRNLWENVIIKEFPKVLQGELSPESLLEVVEEKMFEE